MKILDIIKLNNGIQTGSKVKVKTTDVPGFCNLIGIVDEVTKDVTLSDEEVFYVFFEEKVEKGYNNGIYWFTKDEIEIVH